MPAAKLKASHGNHRKGSTSGVHQKPEPSSASRKKRRIISDEEEDEYHTEPPESEEDEDYPAQGTPGKTRHRPKMSQSQAPNADKLFEDDADINMSSPPHDIPDRAPTPTATPSRKRSRRKKSVPVFSDDDDEYVDSGRKQDNRDDDFVVVDEPPPKKTTGRKGGAGAGRGRGKAKEKEKGGGIGEIHIKDERKLPRPARAAAATGADTKAGAKRRRETVSEAKAEGSSNAEATAAGASSSTTAAHAKQAPEGAPTTLPPSKVRKLPPIKKNKNLAGATSTAPSSGPTTPSGPATASTKAFTPAGLPIHTSLPRKPIPKTSDVDLSSPDIYNSLFKTGSGAPRVGVNSRDKEEERRKELMKMRDEARAVRMANLQKNSFNLLAAQDKISRFEEKLRARNSPALYPNHLAPALKIISMQRNAGLFQRRPGCNVGNINGSSSSGTGGGVS